MMAGRSTGQSTTLFHDVSEGLSQKTVTEITHDNHGFLWVGTHYGLNRFDGVEYKVFLNEESNPNSLSNNHINALEYDPISNILWIGTYGGGLDRFQLDQDSITHFRKDLSNLSGDYITDLYLDETHLWIAMEKTGLSVINTKTNQRVDKVKSFNLNLIKNGYFTSIEKVDEKIILGSYDKGLMILDLEKGSLVSDPSIKSPIRCLTKTNKSTIIAGTNTGLYSIKLEGGQITTTKIPLFSGDSPVVLSLCYSKKKKTLYVGTENKGMVVIDEEGTKETHTTNYSSNTISGNSVWSIHEDKTGIIWLGFFYKGIAKIDALESKFFEISKFEADAQKIDLGMVNSLILTDNVLWIGTDGDGLYSWNSITQESRIHDIWQDQSQQVVTSLLETSEGEIWVGTWNEGIIIIDSKDGTVKDRILSEEAHVYTCIVLILMSNMKLKDAHAKLPTTHFLKIFRSTIINLNHLEWVNHATLK